MINVGKIVMREMHNDKYNNIPEENISVGMDEGAIQLTLKAGHDMNGMRLSPKQAIEVGQMLLKAAEVHPEYAVKAKQVREETEKLAVKYKDMISGLGLETETDVVDARGTFKVIESA